MNEDLGVDGALQGRLLQNASTSSTEVRAKRLSDGKRVAVLLLNTDDKATSDVTVRWADLGLSATAAATVRDLWLQKDLGSFTGSFTALQVPPHGVTMITVQVA